MTATPPPAPAARKFPELPEDLWRQIAHRLPRASLDTLSRVNKLCNRAATSEDLFRARHLTDMAGISPPTNLSRTAPPSALYRRSHALHHPPTLLYHAGLGPTTHILTAIGENLILFDATHALLTGLPALWRRDARELCADPAALPTLILELPDAQLGVLHSTDVSPGLHDAVRLTWLDAASGRTTRRTTLPLANSTLTDAFTVRALPRPRVALLAGAAGAHVAYVTRDARLHVARLSDGALVRTRADAVLDFGRLVRAPCAATGGFVVSAVVMRETTGASGGARRLMLRDVLDDTPVETVLVARHDVLIDVARSSDGAAVGLRILQGGVRVVASLHLRGADRAPEERVVVGRGGVGDAAPSCGLAVVGTGCRTQLQLVPCGPVGSSSGRIVRLRLGDTPVIERLAAQRIGTSPFEWACMAGDGVVVACVKISGYVSVFDVGAGRCLGSWKCGGRVRDVVMVGGHFVVAGLEDGRICVMHFGKFCNGRFGWCPGVLERLTEDGAGEGVVGGGE